MSRKKIVAGNWKMNLTVKEGVDLIKGIDFEVEKLIKASPYFSTEIVVAPNMLSIYPVQSVGSQRIKVAAQDVHYENNGAYTGKISTAMLSDIGVGYSLVGHSEQRILFGETNQTVNLKVKKLLADKIVPIVCIGETIEERDGGRLESVLSEQVEVGLAGLGEEDVKSIVVAYEPVWAIGTGRSASSEEAQSAHEWVRKVLEKSFGGLGKSVSILYGGSVKPANAKNLFIQPDIDGALVGGASLKVDDFLGIIKAYL